MSAATDQGGTFAIGDRVYVLPDNQQVALHLRGVTATVLAVGGSRAQLQLNGNDQLFWVEVELLRPERRRTRQPVDWVRVGSPRSAAP